MRSLKIHSTYLKTWAIGSCLAASFFVTSCDVPKPDQSDSKPSVRKDTAKDSDDDSSDKPKDFASITKSLAELQAIGAQSGEAVELLAAAIKISPKQAADWAATLRARPVKAKAAAEPAIRSRRWGRIGGSDMALALMTGAAARVIMVL